MDQTSPPSSSKICIIPDCNNEKWVRQICCAHYQRVRKHGTFDLVHRCHNGAANGTLTPEYQAWVSSRNRCFNSANKDFSKYGGRGISVCERWIKGENGQHPFECFLADVGMRPTDKHSLDRIDVNGDYEPTNCRWVVHKIQCRNRRSNRLITAFGETLPLIEWSERTGLSGPTISQRIKAGWLIEDALQKPLMR